MTFDLTWSGPEDVRPALYRSQQEKDIWHACVVDNEYRLGELQASDVVIDIGCNIGGFTYLAHRQGSRRIYAFDPDAYAIEAARANVGHLQGVHITHEAVCGNDGPARVGHGILFDSIVAASRPIRFLKIDCEGDEWPILYTSRQLDNIQEIAGEYHVNETTKTKREQSPQALSAFLAEHGFSVELSPDDAPLGLFFAKRTL